jgi:serine phosphatase RsbU (regulator of sigma subunit)
MGAPSYHEQGDGAFTLGRGTGSDVIIPDYSMSRQHARILFEGDGWLLEDLGARNGTFLNGTRLEGRRALAAGDVIRLGGTTIRVELPGQARRADSGALGTSIFRSVSTLNLDNLEGAAPGRIAARLKALNEFHRAMAEPIDLAALLDRLLDQLFAALQAEEALVLLRQMDGSFATAASRRMPGARGELVVSRRLIVEVVEKDAAALVTDLDVDERFTGAESIIGSGIRSILAAPISDALGCVGMVAVYSRASVRRFGEEDLELLVSLSSAAALRIRNVALAEEAAARRVQDRELALAHEIQMGMLPRPFAARDEVQLAARLIPARAVGGDLFDYFVTGDRLWFIVADAAGKGVSAALFMAVTRTLFRAIVHDDARVGAVVGRMNAELARDNERQFFVTALAGCLELRTGELTFANAGHLPPLRIAGSKTIETVEAASIGIALGILEGAEYEEATVMLSPGDLLVVITDGVTEAIDPGGTLFTDARLLDTLRGLHGRAADEVAAGVVTAVTSFAAGAPQEDDITVLALRYLPEIEGPTNLLEPLATK